MVLLSLVHARASISNSVCIIVFIAIAFTCSFEQFCINYCNEKLQQLFIQLVLKREQVGHMTVT